MVIRRLIMLKTMHNILKYRKTCLNNDKGSINLNRNATLGTRTCIIYIYHRRVDTDLAK